jgi:prevent-host-death family protein
MKTIKASDFKARCLRLMDEVDKTGEPIVITKNGRPISKLVAIHTRPATLFGALPDSLHIRGDIVGPVDAEWDAEK